MFFYALLLMTIFCIAMSIRTLFLPYKVKGKQITFENFLFLAMIYATVMVGFGLIYFLIEHHGHSILSEKGAGFFERLQTGLYFSAITLFSVGYGDIAPLGIGRMIAVIEALIGYTIPAAFVARAVFEMDK